MFTIEWIGPKQENGRDVLDSVATASNDISSAFAQAKFMLQNIAG